MSGMQETYQDIEEVDPLVEELKQVQDRKLIIHDSLYTKKPGLALYVCNNYIPHVKYELEKVGELFQCSATVQFGNKKLTFVAKNTRLKVAKNDASRFVVARFFPTYLNKSFPDFCNFISSEIINCDINGKSSLPSPVSNGTDVQIKLDVTNSKDDSQCNDIQDRDQPKIDSKESHGISNSKDLAREATNSNKRPLERKKKKKKAKKVKIENNLDSHFEFGSNLLSSADPNSMRPVAKQQIGSNYFTTDKNSFGPNYQYGSNCPSRAASLGMGPFHNFNQLKRPSMNEYSSTIGPPKSKYPRMMYMSEFDQYEMMNYYASLWGFFNGWGYKNFEPQFYNDILGHRMNENQMATWRNGYFNNEIPQSYIERIIRSSVVPNENANFDNDSLNPEDVGNIIYNLVNKKFQELRVLSPDDEIYYKYDVLSGVVLVRNGEYKQGEVVAIGTGNRMIDSRLVSEKGDVVHDSHAEIVCMRAMKIYFYSQLAQLATDSTKSIFEVRKNARGKYFLKDGIAFHLYINSAPCGDGRIFSLNSEDKHPNRKSRGVLRVKLHAGAGTIPNTTYEQRMLRIEDVREMKENFLTACCSDKLARANILGFQGAILNNIIDPIYFESLTVGLIFQKDHLNRALNGRTVLPQEKLQEPFRINSVNLYRAANEITPYYTTSHAKYSINWISGQGGVEINFPLPGKTSTEKPSRLCKLNLFKLFADYCQNNSPETFSNSPDKSYVHFKSLNTSYQSVKNNLYDYFEESGRGKWKLKPQEWDCFYLDEKELS